MKFNINFKVYHDVDYPDAKIIFLKKNYQYKFPSLTTLVGSMQNYFVVWGQNDMIEKTFTRIFKFFIS